jgi:hypothetical protein
MLARRSLLEEPEMGRSSELPVSVAAAVDAVLAALREGEKVRIAAMCEDELIDLHDGLGTSIRELLGLQRGNPALVEATGALYAIQASMFVIDALWRRLCQVPVKRARSASRFEEPISGRR